MWWHPLLLVFVLISNLSLANSKYETTTIEKIRLLQTLSENSTPSGTIILSGDDYRKLFLKEKWPYFAVVLYGAPGSVCSGCQAAAQALDSIASLYIGNEIRQDSEGRFVFFATIDLSVNQDIARIHKLETVPHVGVLTPDAWTESGVYTILKSGNVFKALSLEDFRTKLLGFVNQASGVVVGSSTSTTRSISFIMMLAVFLGFLVWLGWKLFFFIQRKAWMQAACAVVIQWLATSGLCFNLIHGMVFSGMDQRRRPVYIHSNPRSQYLAEGLGCSGLAVIAGLFLVSSILLPRWNWFCRKVASPTTTVAVSFAVIGWLYRLINFFHQLKNPWIHPTMFPGPELSRGSWRVDRGYY